MLTVGDIVSVGCIFVWALLLGIINVENKLYIFMMMWVGLTYIISSHRSVELVVKIITWALVANIWLCLLDSMCRAVCNLLRGPPSRRRAVHVAPAA